ncbi:MAG TPA: FHA domain-containing protein [Polyangiaceae bacterium]|jgi:hypothetical protein
MKSVRPNASTRLASEIDEPQKETSLDVAYRLALAADKDCKPPVGYRLYWLSSQKFGSIDVPVELEAFLVVGRHSQCDVVLDGDPTIALRHLLVRVSLLDDGSPRLSIVDLHTDLGFQLAGGRSEQSISATGPIALRVGSYAIVALPGGEPMPAELPVAACTRALVAHPYREAARPAITLLPRVLEIGESQGDTSGKGWTVTLEGARGAASVRLAPLDLEIGVLVGRAPKCNDHLRDVLHEGISRVHLLLRKGVAYDLASTQGTFERERRVRAARLDDGTELRMGTTSPITLRWRST